MIAWMYCVGEGWRSCEDATMSKSLPVASLFCWFCKYEVHELVYFLTFRKNGIMFCFVLFCSFGNRSESFLFEWSTFLFLVQKHWYVKFLRWVGWWGEGWVGWTAKRTTSRTCFLYISDKKGTFHFHFSDKIHIKRNFLKKGTKWQSLVNSPPFGFFNHLLAPIMGVFGYYGAARASIQLICALALTPTRRPALPRRYFSTGAL